VPNKLTKAPWSELFFDLAMVGAFLSFGSDFSKEKTWAAGIELAFKLLLIVWAWEQVALFVNRFGDPFATEESGSRTIMGIRFAGLLVLVAVVVVSVIETSYGNGFVSPDDQLSVAAAAVVLTVALLYELGGRWRPDLRPLATHRRNAALLAAVFFIASAPLTMAWSVAAWITGLAIVLYATLGPGLGRTLERFPINREHFSERLGLFVLILIGEVFVKNVVTSHTVDQATTDVLQLGFVAVICWMLWTIYEHEALAAGLPPGPGGLRAWTAGHYLLALAMIVASVGLVWYVTPDYDSPPGDWIAMVAVGGSGLVIATIALIRLAAGGPGARVAALRVLAIAIAALAIGLLAWLATPSDWRVGVGTLAVALVVLNHWRSTAARRSREAAG
jgi:low temperature requirement protein LtrA